MKIELTQQALDDVHDVQDYYLKEVGELISDDFLINFDDTVNMLKTFPLSGQKYNYKLSKKIKIRFICMTDFPFVIFYVQKNKNTFQIIRILHSKRNINELL